MSLPIIRMLRFLLVGILALCPLGLHSDEIPMAFMPSGKAHLGPARTSTGTLSMAVGNANLKFSGSWAPILHDNKVVGLYLAGKGTLDYVSNFEPEWQVFTQNLKEWSSVKPVKSGNTQIATLSFNEARVFLGGVQAPAWGEADAAQLEDKYVPFDQRWSKVDGYFPAHLLALQSMNAPGKVSPVVELERGSDRWVYTYDGVDHMEETLQCVRPMSSSSSDLKDWQYLVGLSRQPIGWDPKKGLAPTHFLLSGLDIDLRTKDNRNVEIVTQETILPLEEGLRVFRFDFWSNLVTEKDTRYLRVKRITDGEGRQITYSHSHDNLAVLLPTPARKGVPFTLRVEYGGDLLIQPREDNYWQLGVREGWYPTPENLASESYTFHGTVRTTGDWIAFLPGETVRREKDGEWNLVETRTAKPINFATILGGKYFLDEETRNGLTVRIATYAFKPGRANNVFKAQAFNIIGYYQNFLGPFPFKEFLIVEKNEWGYGQAPPGMMYITRDAFEQIQEANKLKALADSYEMAKRQGYQGPGLGPASTMDVRHVFAHEIAHQYWGIVVKMPSHTEQWITESFADYCSALFERDYKGKEFLDKNLARWQSNAENSAHKAPIPLANQLMEKDLTARFYTRRNLLYAKGPLILHALHQELGDQVFLTWLKSIQTNFRWKFVTTYQMLDLLRFITKKDFMPFYNEYYWGLALPPKTP